VAEELGVPVEKVNVVWSRSTDLSTYSWQTVASRSTFMDGNAVLAASKDAKEQIKEIASQALRVPKENLVLADERVFLPERPEVGLFLREVVMGYSYPNGNAIGGPVIGRGTYLARGLTHLNPETGQGSPALVWTFGAQAVEVEVDEVTGELSILKVVSAYDVGKTINPQLTKGQVYGGLVQALGIALMEEYVYDGEGMMLNSNLADYKIPRASDIPEEHTVIMVENPQKDAPYGARGVAELAMLAVGPAIANAVYDATGVDIKELPMSPEKVWKAIWKKKGG
jgi:CO/xanthine dehydrogenase Mo-binding subunit